MRGRYLCTIALVVVFAGLLAVGVAWPGGARRATVPPVGGPEVTDVAAGEPPAWSLLCAAPTAMARCSEVAGIAAGGPPGWGQDDADARPRAVVVGLGLQAREAGSTLTVEATVQTSPRAAVHLVLRVVGTAHTLGKLTRDGTADANGLYTARLRVTLGREQPMRADLTVTASDASGSATQSDSLPLTGLGGPGGGSGAGAPPAPAPVRPIALPARRVGGLWQPVGGNVINGGDLDSGAVGALVVVPRGPTGQTVYAGGFGGGVWREQGGNAPGAPWVPTTDALGAPGVGALAWTPAAGGPAGTIFALTGSRDANSVGVLRSADGATTWRLVGRGLAGLGWGYRLAIVPPAAAPASRGPVLLAAMGATISHGDALGVQQRGGGIFRSPDGGLSWRRVLPASPATGNDTALSATDVAVAGRVAYAALTCAIPSVCGGAAGLYKSVDGGRRWTRLAGFDRAYPPGIATARIALTVPAVAPRVVYAAVVRQDGTVGGLYASDNAGGAWRRLAAPPVDALWHALVLAVDPRNPAALLFAGEGVARSDNGGRTWRQAQSGLHVDQNALAQAPDGSWYLGDDGGISWSRDGGMTWAKRDAGLDVVEAYAVAAGPSRTPILFQGIQDDGLCRLDQLGTPPPGGPPAPPGFPPPGSHAWHLLLGGDVAAVGLDPAHPGVLVVANTQGELARTTTGGALSPAWSDFSRPPEPVTPGLFALAATRLFMGGTRVWLSADLGATWRPLSPARLASGRITALAAAGAVVVAGTDDGHALVTLDGGARWRRVALPAPGGAVATIVLNLRHPRTMWAEIGGAVGMNGPTESAPIGTVLVGSTDGGATWRRLAGPVRDPAASPAVSTAPLAPLATGGTGGPLYEARGGYVVVSMDGGRTWAILGHGLPHVWVSGLALGGDGTLYAATFGRGAWAISTGQSPG